jgi:hypothetical protein
MINTTVPPASSSLPSVTSAIFNMTLWTKKNRYAKSILAGLGGAGCLGLLATAAVAQTAMMPASLPLYFEANQGQVDSPAQFIARGCDSQFLISPDSAQFVLSKMTASLAFSARAVRMQFVGANGRAQISGTGELSGKINYLVGNEPARWQTGVATFARVHVGQLYPGVNLTYYGNQRQLEYDFTVAPDANPAAIAIRFDGADKISVSPGGELVLNLGDGEIRQPKPVIYQIADGARKEISGGYKILDTRTVAFAVGDYNHSLPLVIDPILSYSTYFGGNADDIGWKVAVDTNGFVYVAGQTLSSQFAVNTPLSTPGAIQTNYQGGSQAGDAFVAKFSNSGSNLVYFTYLGGSADDAAYGLAVDAAGDAYIAGATESPNFPTKNAIYTNISGVSIPHVGYPADAFVAELNPSGSNLVYSTYLGGGNSDAAYGIAVDLSGNTYVTGFTYSTNFPVTNAIQNHLACFPNTIYVNNNANAFVTKISAGGSPLLYSSYFGGTNYDLGKSIAVDSAGYVYVAGFTDSTNFPTTNAFQTVLSSTNYIGGNNAFVAKFGQPSTTNLSLVYSTFLGGTNNDEAFGIAFDSAGNAYVTGGTTSPNFPDTMTNLSNGLTNNPIYGYAVTTNAFLTQIVWNGTNAAIGYSTVFGGTNLGIDIGYGVAVDPAGNVFVCGASSSTNFPTLNATNSFAATNSGGFDAFVIAFGTNANSLLYSGYLGGTANDLGYGIAVDPAGDAYIVGQTSSVNFPTNNARQAALNGTSDAFLAKITLTNDPPSLSLLAESGGFKVAWNSGLPFEPELSRLFKLESSTNPSSTNWVPVPQQPVLINNRYTVLVNPTNKALYFRLHAF